MEMTWYWERFEPQVHLQRRDDDDFPGCKSTEPLRKENQSTNKINHKEKERARNQGVTNLPPLKKSRPRELVARVTSMT